MAILASTRDEVAAGSPLATVIFFVKASRPGLWATAAWFYLLPLARHNVFQSSSFWVGIVYVSLPLGLLIYGWNDIADAEIDRFNPRKGTFLFGARGSGEQLARLPMVIAIVQLLSCAIFWHYTGGRILIWFAGLVAFTAIYNFPRYGFKSHPPLDILNQAGYLLVFVLSSWLNHVPQLRWSAMLLGALFAMHSHVFGEVMDLEPDRVSGRRTTATVIGRIPSKFLISGMLLLEAALIQTCCQQPWISAVLAVGAFWFLLDALVIWRDRPYSLRHMRIFMLAWNAIALASMPWMWSHAPFAR